jgi:hypothetical protein
MTDTPTRDPLTEVYECCALLASGMYRASLHAASGLPDDVFTDALNRAVALGRVVHEGGRYRAVDLPNPHRLTS